MNITYLKLPDFLQNPRTIKVIGVLLIIDIFFIVLHILHKTYVLTNTSFAIDHDKGYAEIFQYLKEFCIVLLLAYLFFKKKEPIYVVWCLLFLYLLLDDSLKIHEQLGAKVAKMLALNPSFNLRAQDFGEMFISGFVGFAFLLGIILSFKQSSQAAKKFTYFLLFLFFALAFCGIVVDAMHSMSTTLDAARWIKGLFAILEDGGEQIVMSFIVVFIYMKAEQVSTVTEA
jgi:hypothetical protein